MVFLYLLRSTGGERTIAKAERKELASCSIHAASESWSLPGTLYPSPKILRITFITPTDYFEPERPEQAVNGMHLSLARSSLAAVYISPTLIRHGPEIMCLRGSAGLMIWYSCVSVCECQ